MTRTARFKIIYLATLAVLGILSAAAVFIAPEGRRTAVMIVLALILFLPGRIQGWILREHFRGRRLADAGRFEESIRESEAFLARVAREPWRKRAVWLGGVAYSRDIEAMTINNVGVAALHLGDLDKAGASFRRALALDPEYPIPHRNLAVLASMRGDEQAAREEWGEAERLGYTAGRFDDVLREAQRVLAAVEEA